MTYADWIKLSNAGQTEYGGTDDPRSVPLLSNLSDLLPWVKQRHPEPHPDFGGPPLGRVLRAIRAIGSRKPRDLWDQIRGWTPPAATKAKRATKTSAKRATRTPTEEAAERDASA